MNRCTNKPVAETCNPLPNSHLGGGGEARGEREVQRTLF